MRENETDANSKRKHKGNLNECTKHSAVDYCVPDVQRLLEGSKSESESDECVKQRRSLIRLLVND